MSFPPYFRSTLRVDLENEIFAQLKKANFNLCICKKVNNTYNVVWSGNNNFLMRNTFQWTERYSVFGSSEFQIGKVVQPSTRLMDIQRGQTSVINWNCDMDPPTGPPMPTGPFTVANKCTSGDRYVGVAQEQGPYDKKPIYLSTYGGPGVTSLNPVNSVLVFFHPTLQTGMVFQEPIFNAIEIEYTSDRPDLQAVLLNNNSQWVVEGNVQEKRSYSPEKGVY